ncbi:MAG: F0F1 ATP synthase subunit delta [bacterium]|nr:F0F1 ATP synthase subunit delta [bacterium]
MAKKTTQYALALLKALDGKQEKEQRVRVARFKKLLKKRGDLPLLSSVLQEFSKFWEQRQGKLAFLVSGGKFPHSVSASIKKTLVDKGYQLKEGEDARLIGGSAVFLGSEYLIDNSVKGKLEKLKIQMTPQ